LLLGLLATLLRGGSLLVGLSLLTSGLLSRQPGSIGLGLRLLLSGQSSGLALLRFSVRGLCFSAAASIFGGLRLRVLFVLPGSFRVSLGFCLRLFARATLCAPVLCAGV
jgi:hypothetical protein